MGRGSGDVVVRCGVGRGGGGEQRAFIQHFKTKLKYNSPGPKT